MKSMTGYSKASLDFENRTISVELKSVNSKQCDVNIKLPNIYRQEEINILNLIKEKLVRGKIDCFISITYPTGNANLDINQELFKAYFNQLSKVTNSVGADKSYLTAYLLQRDDINQMQDDVLSEQEIEALLSCTKKAIELLDNYRSIEGNALQKAFDTHVDLIEKYSLQIAPFEKNRIPIIKDKIISRFKELNIEGVEPNRLEQELIFYLEKLDITEERIRLAQHIKYFRQTMLSQETIGKKLGFIAQEMGREINTLGSKSNEADMQRLVVMMKDELEKIKEQSANVL